MPRANLKRKSIQEAEDRSETLVHVYLLGGFPRRLRSKRRVICKDITTTLNADFHEDQMTKSNARQPRLPACRRAHQKKKRRQKDEETSEPEVVCPSLGRERSKKRVNCDSEITPQQGKLDTHMFQCYLENLWMSFTEERTNSFTYLDCLWFALYKKESFEAKVLNWIKKKRIFSKNYVFVPIVRWFVLDIYKSEGRPENEEQIYRIPLKVPKVPQQRNGDECGNFVLYYLNLFTESAPESFSISEGYPYFMKEDWFSPEGLACFCQRLDSFC